MTKKPDTSPPAAVTRSDWLAAIAGLVRAAQASRAPHRPIVLLYMLGRAQRGDSRDVGFGDLEQALAEVLGRSTRAKKADAFLPFWHLRSSPFWEVINEGALELRSKSNDRPTRGALIAAEARGAIRELWWSALSQPDVVRNLGEQLLRSMWANEVERADVARLVRFTRDA